MKSFFYSLACVLGMLAGVSNAGSIGSVINPLVVSRLSDNSLEVLWNAGQAGPGTGDTIVGIGDRLVTIARVDQVSSPFGAPNVNFGSGGWTDEFTLVSVIQVHDVAVEGAGFRYTFVPSSVADPLGLGWTPQTMVAMYSDPANDYTGSPGSIAAGIAQASGGTEWWEFGMNGGGASASTGGPTFTNALGEFWTALASTNDISSIGGLPPGVSGGVFNLGLNLVALNGGIPLANVFGALEVTGTGNLLGGGAAPAPGGYQAFDDINFSIRTIPEPGSMTIFGLLAAAAGVGYRRRRS